MPLREVAVCRELTKLHEEVACGTAERLAEEFAARTVVKGEIVIVIDAPNDEEEQRAAQASGEQAEEAARRLLAEGQRPKQVARAVAETYGIARNAAYELVLALRDEGDMRAGKSINQES